MKITIPILTNSYSDLTELDFSFKNISILDIESFQFEKYLQQISPNLFKQANSFLENIRNSQNFNGEKKYAIVSNSPLEYFNYQEIIKVWKLLLIVYPSLLQIQHELELDIEDNDIDVAGLASYNSNIRNNDNLKLFIISSQRTSEFNSFSQTVFDRLLNNNYISVAIENYLNSFNNSSPIFQYLTLCMTIESIVSGSAELTFRLKRNTAVLCGETRESSKNIFDNVNKIYQLRSKIIHGEKINIEKISEYLCMLRSIASRVIIELLIHDISDIQQLNNSLTEIGFGERQEISNNWEEFILNSTTLIQVNEKKIE